jgi:uncharacterized protein (TIGR03083 family)
MTPSASSWADLPIAAADEVLDVLGKAVDEDWSRRAGETDWSCRDLLDHITLGVTGYAALLITRPTAGYPALRTGNDPGAAIPARLESLRVAATLLSHTVRATGPQVRAFHPWGRSDAPGFAAMGAVELLVHAHDVARTFGIDWAPPDRMAEPVLQRLFPNAPGGVAPSAALLWGTGRTPLPGHPQLPREGWQWYGEVR